MISFIFMKRLTGGNAAPSPIDAATHAEDTVVIADSLVELQALLKPQYEAIRERTRQHGALSAVAAADYRFEQAKADHDLLTSFGALLPPEEVKGQYKTKFGG